MTKLSSKEKAGIACVVGVAAAMVAIPLCCTHKSPEKRFVMGGRTMLGAIPDITKKYATTLAARLL